MGPHLCYQACRATHITDEDRALDYAELHGCPVCDGQLVHLGNLGRRAHYRCQDCGSDSTHLIVT